MKKYIKMLISALLAVVMTVFAPIQAVAANKEVYISEMVIEYGASAAEAKSKLTEAGYKVYDYNISNCDNDSDTCGYMYIGYKTTTDPDEAITDIRLMHMGGGYSYAEYEEIIEQKTQEIDLLISNLISAVNEYRINYTNKKEAAVVAYEMLNKLKEDDSGLLMGDYLLDTSKTQADYTDLFLQCSTAVLITVERALAIACSATYDQGIFRISELDKEDFVGEVQYESVATDIYNDLPYIRSVLSTYASSGLTTADGATEAEVKEVFSELSEDEQVVWSESFSLAYILESIELSDGSTLYELFMSDLDELVTEDLYPLASVFSEGQASLISVAGLDSVIKAAVVKGEQWKGLDEYTYEIDEPISVYAGVDRSLFEGGVALTSKAMVEAAANTEKTWFGSLDAETEEIFYDIIGISFFALAGASALYLTSMGVAKTLFSTIGAALNSANWSSAAVQLTVGRYVLAMKCVGYAGAVFGCIALVALGVFLIASAIYLISVGIEYYFPDYDEIPRILVEKNTDDNDETIYTYYHGVKNLSDTVVDINQHDGPRWMSFYTTKDSKAGKPILEGFEMNGENLLSGYTGVRKFSQDAAFNLNKFSYNNGFSVSRDGESVDIDNTYMFYKQSSLSTDTASIFASGNTVTGLIGAVIGLAFGIIGTSAVMKKKKAKA